MAREQSTSGAGGLRPTTRDDASFDAVAYINEPRWHDSRLGLDRTRELLDRLGNPQRRLRFVHVAGTNGKGSTCAMLASVLHASGYRCGLFTSPYILEFADRIRVDGANISADELREVTLCVKDAAEAMDDHPTEFELMTAVAFLHFARRGCDIVVAEVGLGGRLDSTNVIEADELELSIITPIALDHTALLGDTIAEIAGEKAGIVKTGRPVVSGIQRREAFDVIAKAAADRDAPLKAVDRSALEGRPEDFRYRGYDRLRLGLMGDYQVENAATVIGAVEVLRGCGYRIDDDALRAGLAETVWPGRFQIAAHDPLFIVDGGHNVQGAQALATSLARRFPGRRPVFVLGILRDKDYRDMIDILLPFAAEVVTVEPPNPRALSADELADAIRSSKTAPGIRVSTARDIPDAVARARAAAGPDGMVVAAGSLYSVGDILRTLEHRA